MTLPSRSQALLPQAGFTLPELIIVIGLIGVIAATAVTVIGNRVVEGSIEVRARQDQQVLNSAVRAYLVAGGDLSGITNPGEVLSKLKTRSNPGLDKRIPGLSGSFIDESIEFVIQSPEEAERESPRLHWDAQARRFEVAVSGAPGIVSVTRSRVASEVSGPGGPQSGDGSDSSTDEVRSSPLLYSAKSSWIWDYQDQPVAGGAAPAEVPTFDPADTELPVVIPPTDPVVVTPIPPPPAPGPIRLAPPGFSKPAGRYPRDDFNLAVSLRDPNAPGSARLFYSVNHGAWIAYDGGSISVPPDNSLKAQALPVNTRTHEASTMAEAGYEAFDELYAILLPPSIRFSKPSFDRAPDTIVVQLENPNPAAVSELHYQIVPVPGGNGVTTAFATYGSTFAVSSGDYPAGFGIRAFAKATSPGYFDSRPSSRFATARTTLFGGHLDLDTSTSIARIGKGSTDAHSHDILGGGGTSIDFFNITERSQVEIDEAITSASQPFKLIIVNGALSPGMNLIIDYEINCIPRTLDMPVARYGRFPVADLPVFTLGGGGTSARLRGLRFSMDQDLIHQAGIIPTNTAEVVNNVPGKSREWRNGALAVQAVAMNANGSAAHGLDASLSNGSHGAATSGLLWEAAVFWHWPGESFDSAKNMFLPGDFNTIRLFVR
jgi:prepilin-type N-terminal cleavage/methylation domain-containing protein